jgi:hypothetical protein
MAMVIQVFLIQEGIQADFSCKKVLLIKTSLVKLRIGASRVKADVFINGKTCLKRFEKAHNVLYIVVPVLECPLHHYANGNILFQNSKMTTM